MSIFMTKIYFCHKHCISYITPPLFNIYTLIVSSQQIIGDVHQWSRNCSALVKDYEYLLTNTKKSY